MTASLAYKLAEDLNAWKKASAPMELTGELLARGQRPAGVAGPPLSR